MTGGIFHGIPPEIVGLPKMFSPTLQEVNEGYRRCFMRGISRITEAIIVFLGSTDFSELLGFFAEVTKGYRRCSICRINRISKYRILRRSSFCQITRISEDILRML